MLSCGRVHSSHIIGYDYDQDRTRTVLYEGLFDTAADQRVVGRLMANDVQQCRDVSRVSERDLGHQRTLERFPILHWRATVQEVTVLLSWQNLTEMMMY